jgi:ABC-2 type transport system permease protein
MNGEWRMEACPEPRRRACPEPRRRDGRWLPRLRDELAQAWTVAVKDVKVYYLKPGMIMLGFMTPFFLFFSFSVRREMGAAQGVARLLAAPMSLLTLLLGKASVGAFFAIVVSAVALIVGVVAFGVSITQPWLVVAGVFLGSFSFSALGLIFGSIPTRNPGEVQMPSLLLRWGLLFISGVFIPLAEMAPAARSVAYISPLTYAQDLMNHAVLGAGLLSPWLDLAMLLLGGVLFLIPSMLMHRRSRQLGY